MNEVRHRMHLRIFVSDKMRHESTVETMMARLILAFFLTASCCEAFCPSHGSSRTASSALSMIFGGSSAPKIPSSTKERDSRAISSIQRALSSPKKKSCPLIECEFPPLGSLNKLGDGSLRSALEVDKANLDFAKKLIQSLSPPIIGPKVCLLASSAAPSSFLQKATKLGASSCVSLRDGMPDVTKDTICVLLAPSTRSDYETAKSLASQNGNKVVIVNGFAKDQFSVPGEATMAYFLKPLTYNSQVAGYLIREWPSDWVTIDATTKDILQKVNDASILVPKTNTPDLRESGKLVQKSVGEQAMKSRISR